MRARWILVFGVMVGCVSAAPLGAVGSAGGPERAGDDPLERCDVEVALEEDEQTYDVGVRGGLDYRAGLRVNGLPAVPHWVELIVTLESGVVAGRVAGTVFPEGVGSAGCDEAWGSLFGGLVPPDPSVPSHDWWCGLDGQVLHFAGDARDEQGATTAVGAMASTVALTDAFWLIYCE